MNEAQADELRAIADKIEALAAAMRVNVTPTREQCVELLMAALQLRGFIIKW